MKKAIEVYLQGFKGFIFKSLILLVLFIFISTPLFSQENNTNTFKHVLLLQSYYYGHPWEEDVTESVRQRLEESDTKVRLSIDYMDTKRSLSPIHMQNLFALYKEKYKKDHFDVIMANDDNALMFALDHRNQLFNGAPIVFCGVSYYPEQKLKNENNVTGIVQTLEFAKTLNLALKMHPGTERFIFINDNSASAKKRKPQIMAAFKKSSRDVPFDYYDDKTFEEIRDILQNAPPRTILFLHLFDKDITGRNFSKAQVFEMVTNAFSGPIYATKKDYIGYGIVGGYLSDGQIHGKKVADIVLDLLGGRSVAEIPIVSNDVDPPAFAYDQLQRFRLSVSDLPPGSKIYNKPFSFYETYKLQIYLAGTVFVFLIIFIIILSLYIIMRKKEELEKQHLRSMLNNIVNSMPSVIVGVGLQGEILQFNSEAERLSGISAESAKSKFLQEIFPHLYQRMSDVEQVIKYRRPHFDKKVVREEKGKMCYEDITIYPLVTNGIEGAVIRVDDVTHETELEVRLMQSQKMEAIGQLVGGVAHDFNNMLGGIMGAVELLSMNASQEDEQFLKIIKQAAEKAAELISKLMQFSRKGNVAKEPVNIHGTIENTVALLRRSIDKKVEIKVSCEAPMHMTQGRDTQIQNSLLNIGINASQAMPEGGVLTFTTENVDLDEIYCQNSLFDIRSGTYIKISVRDTGTGIKKQDITKIFDPFFTTKKQGKGTGLGLSAVFGTVQNHQGAITVYSEWGKGTVFHLYLPVFEQIEAIPVREEKAVLGRGLILVVDDEEFIRETSKSLLESLGYSVLVAENASQAEKIYKEQCQDIDLVLLDMIMPDKNGREVFKDIKAINKDAKVIIASGFSRNEDVAGLKELGLCAFLPKPFHRAELSQIIAEVLAKQ